MALRLLFLSGIFLFGYLEHATWGKRDVACATWFLGLAALVIWIVYPLSAIRICAGGVILMCGVSLLILYYKKCTRDTSRGQIAQN